MGDAVIKFRGYFMATPRDETLWAIFYERNKNVEFLPENTKEKFPNLVMYDASHCALKAISKVNFNGLMKLKYIWLGNNSIEVIKDDTFEGLKSLLKLHLGEIANMIRKIIKIY